MAAVPALLAQEGACSSDGQTRPRALVQRFISADCEACWRSGSRVGAREVAIDWIVPSTRGDEAPLSAAASSEALERLAQLPRKVPFSGSHTERQALLASARTLRVTHGVPADHHIGTSIELRPAGRAPWTAWLVLVETIPAGTEGTPIERKLVRGAYQAPWDGKRGPDRAQRQRLFESRDLRVPEGVDATRLSVVAWVEDARGRIRAISESKCGTRKEAR